MKYAKKQLLFFIVFTGAGVAALLAALFIHMPAGSRTGIVSGIVGGFLLTGGMGILISVNMLRHPQRAEKIQMEKTEERTAFIRMKTLSAVYTVSLFVICAATIVALLLQFTQVAIVLAAILILQVFLHVGFANYYSRKY